MSRSPDDADPKAAGRVWSGWSWIVVGAMCVVVGCLVFAMYSRYKHEADGKAVQDEANAAQERFKADIEKYGAEYDATRVYKDKELGMGEFPMGNTKLCDGPIKATLDRGNGRWTVTGSLNIVCLGEGYYDEIDRALTLFYTPADQSWHVVSEKGFAWPHERRRVSTRITGEFVKPVRGDAPTSSLRIASSQGDFIGQGQSYSYAGNDLTVQTNSRGVTVTVGDQFNPFDPNGWSLKFGGRDNTMNPNNPPNSRFLEVGEYGIARGFEFSRDAPGINVHHQGHGCNNTLGKFVVWEIEVKEGKIARLAIDFIQYCEEEMRPLCGSLRVNSSFRPEVPVGESFALPWPMPIPRRPL